MAAENTQSLREDIAFMRDLAEAGVNTPLVSGLIFIVIGASFGLASLAHWAWFRFGQPEGWMIAAMWIGATVLCWTTVYAWPMRMIARKPGAGSVSNRVVAWAWRSTGWTINLSLACALIISWRTQSYLPFALFPSLITAIYGGAWLVSQRMSGQSWMWAPALGGFAFSLILAYFVTSPHLYLLMAAAMFLLAFAPGVVMIRREPSLVV